MPHFEWYQRTTTASRPRHRLALRILVSASGAAILISGCADPSPGPVIGSPPPPPAPPPAAPPPPPVPPPPPASTVAVRIDGGPVLTLTLGDVQQLAASLMMSDGTSRPVTAPAIWRTSTPEQLSVTADGVVSTTATPGAGWLHVETAGFRDSAAVWVQPPESEPSSFRIRLVYLDSHVPAAWVAALERGARRWEQVVRRALPPVDPETLTDHCQHAQNGIALPRLPADERGVVVFIRSSDTFQPGTWLPVVGGQCSHRGLPFPTTVTGAVTLNVDKFDSLPEQAYLEYLAVHELGHVLGLVGATQAVDLEHIVKFWIGPLPVGAMTTGTFTRHGYWLQTGERVAGLSFDYGSAHWSGEFSDVMAIGQFSPEEIRTTSIGALMDLGYIAAWYGDGPI